MLIEQNILLRPRRTSASRPICICSFNWMLAQVAYALGWELTNAAEAKVRHGRVSLGPLLPFIATSATIRSAHHGLFSAIYGTRDLPLESIQLAQRLLNDGHVIFAGSLDIKLRSCPEIHLELPLIVR